MTRRAPWLLLLAACLAGCGRPAPEPAPDVSIAGGRLKIRPDSRLIGKLEILPARASGQQGGLRMIGQIVALANPSAGPSGPKIDWSTLDPEVLSNVQLRLDRLSAQVGDVIGLTELPRSYLGRVSPGKRVQVARYGVTSQTQGRVLFARPDIHWGEDVPILFKIEGDPAWLPGSNCEVIFPLIRSQAVKVPTTAILHEGIHEYVLKQAGPQEFVPRAITIGEGDPDEMEVVTGLFPDDTIVGRGAILLKPFLHQWLILQGHPDAP